MPEQISREERMRLMRFVCSFAWADLEVQHEERTFIGKLMKKLLLTADEKKQVAGWLKVPPAPEGVDPTDVPKAHRKLLLETITDLVAADHRLSVEERENFDLLEQLLDS